MNAKEATGQTLLDFELPPLSLNAVTSPKGYTGLSAFHKYWGKKPIECLGFLIERLTKENDLVVDPFVGSGLLGRECASRQRRFIGIDINPVSIELSRLVSDLPSLDQYRKALQEIEKYARPLIDACYSLEDGRIATHFLWEGNILREIWISGNAANGREVFRPSDFDRRQAQSFQGYSSRLIRPLHFFDNSRINTSSSLQLGDIFTPRALQNIDVLLEQIHSYSGQLRRALLLTLTASVGQMSNMVFAITGRGKTNGNASDKVEVGSWVIGYWRPTLHFEVNAWNCFERRSRKLVAAIRDLDSSRSFPITDCPESVLTDGATLAFVNDDAIHCFRTIPQDSVALVLADPPHSDRIPYLELSELWNAILGLDSDFDNEIVVSNARERSKTKTQYNSEMGKLLDEVHRVLTPGGFLALLFNARDGQSWTFLSDVERRTSMKYIGSFSMAYSANSVVQDNRRGAMKSDYVLLYVKEGATSRYDELKGELARVPGWSEVFPQQKG